jgi:hypothetical protein
MSAPARDDAFEAGQRRLTAHLARLRARLEAAAAGEPVPEAPDGESAAADLVEAFGLSPFERDLVLLCAGVELESAFAPLCARLNGDPGRPWVTFALACAVLPDPHWTAVLPSSPLRRWRLVEVDAARRDAPLVQARLAIGERVLHHLTGLIYLDEALRPLMRACAAPAALLPAHADGAALLARHLKDAPGGVMLAGAAVHDRRAVAALAARELGVRLCAIDAAEVPAAPEERDALARLWEREALLSPAVLLVECDGASGVASALVDAVVTPVIVGNREPLPSGRRPLVRLELRGASSSERRAWWAEALGERSPAYGAALDALAAQFDLGPNEMDAAIASAEGPGPGALWRACRVQARPALGDLAQRIESAVTWDDLVLPPAQTAVLRQIRAQMRQRLRVYEQWGFAGAGARGLGISALFAGPSGTGKTMAAEVLANDLDLDLYRIDLSQVVSKYIGETEKNLRRVFDAAERGGAILLFDEADALFGKRSEVKDSHDRYANIEVSYLLQQMEAYRGLAILTTNQRGALDAAFVRRLRAIVEFPFPDAAMRAEIWRRAFPPAAPTAGLDPRKLARLNVAGGSIRSIALSAAFLAADGDEPIGMRHVLRAARTEYAKMDKPLTDAETVDWGA